MTAQTQDASAALDVMEDIVALERADPDVLLSELATLLLGLQGDSPYRPRVHRLLGVVRARLGSDDDALRELAEAKALAESQSPPAYRELARIGRETAAVLVRLGDPEPANEELRTALAFAALVEDQVEVARIIAVMGGLERDAQHFDSVIKLYRSLVLKGAVSSLPPREALGVRADLCQALNRMGRPEEALQQVAGWREALSDDDAGGHFRARLEEARALAGLGRHDDAERVMVEAEKLLPAREDAVEQSAFIQVVTEMQEAKGGPPAAESLGHVVQSYAGQGQGVHEVVARRAQGHALLRAGDEDRAREALAFALCQAIRHGLGKAADEIRADLLKHGPAHVEPLAGTIDLVGGSDDEAPQYMRLRRVGAGPQGETWLAADLADGALVDLKTVDLEGEDDVHREAAIAAFKTVFVPATKIDDPRLAHVLSLRLAPGKALYVAQQHVEGPNLRTLYGSGASLERLLGILAEVADALSVLHAQGLVHRNLKPENVVVASGGDGAGRPVLVGLGVPLPAEAEGLFKPLGTAPYMAPEQVEGRPGDGRADLYALGQMIAELWGGKVPARQGLGRLWHRETSDEMPRAVEEIVRGMLASDPEQRTADLSYVAEALRRQRQETAEAATR